MSKDKQAFPVHSVGPDEFCESELEDMNGPYVWLVYWYENSGYEGDGIAVALRNDDKMDIGYLNHCSCYGATEHWPHSTQEMAAILHELEYDSDCPENKKRTSADYDYRQWVAVNTKVQELLAEHGKEAIRKWVYREYWNKDFTHRPYRNEIAIKPGDDENVTHTQMGCLESLFREAGIEDGDEFTITIRKTGKRPFGNKRIRYTAPHTYTREI